VTALAIRPVRVEVLGRVRAWRDGQELSLGPPRQRAVLAVLALRANHVVSRDEIVDAVWGDRPPASAVNGVHLYVSALRRVLADERPGRLLAGSGPGYVLRLEPDRLDLAVAGGHLDRARRLAAAGDPAGAVREFDAALALWHGTPLAGIAGPFAEVERTRLTELRLTAVEDRAEAVLDLGRHRELVPELSTLAAEHPLRERMRAVLMTALYRSGRRSEALTVYAETRRLLGDELGVEPGPQLRDLYRTMLTDDGADAPATDVPRQLPAAVRHFAGRAEELATLSRVADEAGGGPVLISAIEGTAGVGKTALAVYWAHQVAHRYPDGQLYVNLRGFDPGGAPASPGEAVRGFLDALAVPRHRFPVDLAAQSALYRSLLSGRRMLILLDNARDAEQVLPLLPGSASCLVVVTSRNDLSGLVATTGAHLLTVDVLSTAGSRDLLTRRLGAGRVAAEPRAVDDIITACARLPLALAIAAARAAKHPAFPLSVLAAELSVADNGLDAFAGADPRNDIRAVFSWSYRSLSAPAARLFRLLSLPPGADIAVPAAASLAGVPVREVRRLLTELARAYLVTEHSPGRYQCHDLLRAYARELAEDVDSDPDRRAAMHRLLDHHLYATWAADRALNPERRTIDVAPPVPGVTLEEPDHDHALAWLDAERTNLCAAVDHAAAHGFGTHAWQLAWALAAYLDQQGIGCPWVRDQLRKENAQAS
jgi:DNA-binding SARP family transcriptional activator